MKAVSLDNADKLISGGSHYASQQLIPNLPAIVGADGIGLLADGKLVGFGGMKPPYGSMAEVAVIPSGYYVTIPDGVDAVTAAAVPASVLASLFPLKWGANLQAGEVVLVNGATGFAGKLAVQVAKLLGAGRVIATGRNSESLRLLPGLGADAVIDLKMPDAELIDAFKQQAGHAGYHVILDFLWGSPTERLLEALIPDELAFANHTTRLVQIGEMAGPTILLPASALRTSGLTIMGAGHNLTPEAAAEGSQQVWDWIRAGKLRADVEEVPLRDVEAAWKRADLHGRRLVIVP